MRGPQPQHPRQPHQRTCSGCATSMVAAALSTPAGLLNVMASARLGTATAVAKMAPASVASRANLRIKSSSVIGSLNDQSVPAPMQSSYHGLFEGFMADPFRQCSLAGKICGVVKEHGLDLMLFAPSALGIESS